MGDRSGIEWTDATWNPTIGCSRVSSGCDHCYAIGVARRFDGTHDAFNGTTIRNRNIFDDRPDWTGKINLLGAQRLTQPLRWKRPRRIFVNSMSDLFHDAIPDHFIAQVFAVMAVSEQHTFQVLTKRHGRMRSLLSSQDFPTLVKAALAGLEWLGHPGHSRRDLEWPLPNVWLGVSAEDQQWADIRISALLATPAAVRWVSAEPLLGPLRLGLFVSAALPPRLDWVVVGGESGPNARPMHPQWARDIRDLCQKHDVPYLFKQWGDWAPKAPPAGARSYVTHAWTTGDVVVRLGKKAAGRELDGQTYDGYPMIREGVT